MNLVSFTLFSSFILRFNFLLVIFSFPPPFMSWHIELCVLDVKVSWLLLSEQFESHQLRPVSLHIRFLHLLLLRWKQKERCTSSTLRIEARNNTSLVKSLSVYRKPRTDGGLSWSTDFNVTHRAHVHYGFVTCTFRDLTSLKLSQLPVLATGVTW